MRGVRFRQWATRTLREPRTARRSRRPDVVLFVNGLAVAVLEFKNAASEDATIWTAYSKR